MVAKRGFIPIKIVSKGRLRGRAGHHIPGDKEAADQGAGKASRRIAKPIISLEKRRRTGQPRGDAKRRNIESDSSEADLKFRP